MLGKKELDLRGIIDEREGKQIEIRTIGSHGQYKSYCYVIDRGTKYVAVELESYTNELDAREGHLKWLRKRERCLSYLEALEIVRRGKRLWD